MTMLTFRLAKPLVGAISAAALALPLAPCIAAAPSQAFLDRIHRQTTLTSAVPENGDQNPYAIVVAPASVGAIHKDDVLVNIP